MSYEIIKSIKIDKSKKEVKITSASNNISPQTYCTINAVVLNKLYAKKGFQALEIKIIRQFLNGNFQQGSTSYKKIADYMMMKYRKGWSNSYTDEEVVANIQEYKVQPITDWVIKMKGVLVSKLSATTCYSGGATKVFRGRYSDICQRLQGYNKDNWEVLEAGK